MQEQDHVIAVAPAVAMQGSEGQIVQVQGWQRFAVVEAEVGDIEDAIAGGPLD
jgi:hypothetical protein